MTRAARAIGLWMPMVVSACCHPRPPVYVVPPPCLARLAPPPPAETAGDEAWQRYHVGLEGWAAGVERSCGAHLLEPVAVKGDPGPKWWTKQPSGAVGE